MLPTLEMANLSRALTLSAMAILASTQLLLASYSMASSTMRPSQSTRTPLDSSQHSFTGVGERGLFASPKDSIQSSRQNGLGIPILENGERVRSGQLGKHSYPRSINRFGALQAQAIQSFRESPRSSSAFSGMSTLNQYNRLLQDRQTCPGPQCEMSGGPTRSQILVSPQINVSEPERPIGPIRRLLQRRRIVRVSVRF